MAFFQGMDCCALVGFYTLGLARNQKQLHPTSQAVVRFGILF